MPKTRIHKSILIKKSPKEVLEVITNFKKWPAWSPWIIIEPETQLTYADDGKSYEWEGAIIGSGTMEIIEETENKVHYNLTFLKPWKSKSKVSFLLSEQKEGTEVTWTMDGSLPFFMFWMKKTIETYVGMDYERGLKMLKNYVEDGKVHSTLTFEGIESFGASNYIGIKRACSIEEVGIFMSKDFERLIKFSKAENKEVTKPLSIYHKFDPIKNNVNYTAALVLDEIPADLPTDIIRNTLPDMKVHSILHTGPYDHIGNAWSAQVMYLRAKKFKARKGIHPMEVYLNSPVDTPEKELKSKILFATK